MSTRYQEQIDQTSLRQASQNFLSQISLDSKGLRNRSLVRRSFSEQPDSVRNFAWDINENKYHRFPSAPLDMGVNTNRQVRFTKDIRKEECGSQFLFVSKNSSIVGVFSVLPYKISETSTGKRKTTLSFNDNTQHSAQTRSYAELLEDTESPMSTYNPFWLEHPERSTNNYKTDIVLPGKLITFLEYENPELFKKNENEEFKEKWPEVDITLSKMKSIKRDLLKVAEAKNLPIVVLCYSYCYFETLAFSKYINKANRKLVAGACLMVAKKFLFCNTSILSELTEVLRVSQRDIVVEEFRVLAALQFSLHYPETAVTPHYKRLLGSAVVNR